MEKESKSIPGRKSLMCVELRAGGSMARTRGWKKASVGIAEMER